MSEREAGAGAPGRGGNGAGGPDGSGVDRGAPGGGAARGDRALPVLSGTGVEVRPGMGRREALRLMALAAAAPATFAACTPGGAGGGPDGDAGSEAGGLEGLEGMAGTTGGQAPVPAGSATNPNARGDAWDPDLVNPQLRWQKVLTGAELVALAALCDVIIPEDEVSPSASAVGCHDFVDEWVSAPYGFAESDRVLVRGGLLWLDAEAGRRFSAGSFRELSQEQQHDICDDICHEPDAAPEHRMAARFFHKVRDLTLTAFYTTEEGMADIGYVGNRPQVEWPLPPPEVLVHLGIEDEAALERGGAGTAAGEPGEAGP